MAEKKDTPVVLSGFRKNDGPIPVFVAKDMEGAADPVVLKFTKEDEISKGFYVDVPDGKLTTVALSNMALELQRFYKSRGQEISSHDLKLFISGLTSRIVYVPVEEMPLFVSRMSMYYSQNVFYIDRLKDADYLKGCFAACRTPDRLHFFVVNLHEGMPLPNFLVAYIEAPSAKIKVKMEEYVNDIFIGNIKLMDNIYIIATGDIKYLPKPLARYYSVWNPKIKDCDKEDIEFKTMSYSSIKNMHKVMNPISDEIWNKMEIIEDVLVQNGIKLSNKDTNMLDDYIVTLINQGFSEDEAMDAFIQYRLAPMVALEMSKNDLINKLAEVGIKTSGKE